MVCPSSATGTKYLKVPICLYYNIVQNNTMNSKVRCGRLMRVDSFIVMKGRGLKKVPSYGSTVPY